MDTNMDLFSTRNDNLEKFWEREDFGRCALAVCARNSKSQFRPPASLSEKWLDDDYKYEAYKHNCDNIYYGGEFYPSYFVNYGPGSLAACIGGKFDLADNTIWFDREQYITSWENPPALTLDKNCEMWTRMEGTIRRFLQDPSFLTSIPDLGGIADVIAALRGTENLLYDLYDYPDEVKNAIQQVDELWRQAFDALNAIIAEKQQYFTSWIGIPSKKPWFPIQSDFSALLSPDLFEEFILGSIVKHSNHMPRTIYHLDGEGEIPHLDMLLDVENLTGIQWVAGAGRPGATDPCWFSMYKKIQDKKKNLVLLEADPTQLERLLGSIDRVGLFVYTECESPAQADALLNNVEKWCK